MKKMLMVLIVVLMFPVSVASAGCVTPWHQQVVGGPQQQTQQQGISNVGNATVSNSGNLAIGPVGVNAPITATGGSAFATGGSASAIGGAGGALNVSSGAMTQSTTVNAGGGSGTVKTEGYLITQFLDPYSVIPANPLTYTGAALQGSHFASDQMWFKRPKWTDDMIKGLPDGGAIDDAVFEKTTPVKYLLVKDGRTEREWCSEEEREVVVTNEGATATRGKCKPFTFQKYVDVVPDDCVKRNQDGLCETRRVMLSFYYLGPVYCDSKSPGEKPGRVWGGCGRKLLAKSCTYSVLVSSMITQGSKSNAVATSGSLSLAGIFGSIFGFNAGGGASNTDHYATLEEKVNMTWDCYGVH